MAVNKEEEKITFIAKLDGEAAKLVNEKIKEKKEKLGLTMFGKSRAVQILLCELYHMKKKKNGG